jgi:hypothetical protein
MKKVIAGAFSVFFLTIYIVTLAQEASNVREKFEFVKEKNISRTYPASGNSLSIDNSFGNVKFVTWDRNEIKVDVHFEASSDKETVAQKTLEALQISDKQQGSEISFTPLIDKRNDICKDCKSTMHIDYQVFLPASVALNVNNSFGNIELPDYSGILTVKSKFGQLTTGSLPNLKQIGVEFGRASIKSMSHTNATFNFSDIEVLNLGGTNKISLEFCSAAKFKLDSNLNSLDLRETYSTVFLRPGNLAASYMISTSFGSVVDRTYANIHRTDTPDKNGPDSDKTYEGKSGSGSARINISSSFGKIIVGEPTADDLKETMDKTQNTNALLN